MVTEVSILIPVFNQDVTALVHTLMAQSKRLSVHTEILLYDDGSTNDFKTLNRPLGDLANVVYIELPQNIGRAAIRNKLAEDAAYNHLLLLDNDCLPVSSNFLYDYLQAASDHDVVIGGVSYAAKAPEKPYRLHWKYGKERGARCASERNKDPYKDIFLCNALIKKDTFLKFRLREKLTRYGHEDTVFAQELYANKVKVHHIENPVIHLGLEEAPIMLAKTNQAVNNLVELYQDGEQLHQIRLIRVFTLLQKYRLVKTYNWLFIKIEGLVQRNLLSDKPNLLFFDLYRLHLLGLKYYQPALIRS